MGEVLTSTLCPVCGARHLENIKTCPNCGAVEKSHANALTGKAVAWVDSFPIGITNCPKCSGENIQKVSRIVKASVKGDYDAHFLHQLSPPRRPVTQGFWLVFLPALVGLGSSFLLFVFAVAISAEYLAPNKGDPLPDWDVALCGAVAAFGFGVGFIVARRVALTRRARLEELGDGDLDRWIAEMEVWERLYYCSDCDLVHDPLVGRSAHVPSMANLLVR